MGGQCDQRGIDHPINEVLIGQYKCGASTKYIAAVAWWLACSAVAPEITTDQRVISCGAEWYTHEVDLCSQVDLAKL